MAKVSVDVHESDVENEDGRTVEGLILICDKCGHQVEAYGTSAASARRGAFKLREECPQGENNFYDVSSWDWRG